MLESFQREIQPAKEGIFSDPSFYELNPFVRQRLWNAAKSFYQVPGRHYHDSVHIQSMVSKHYLVWGHDMTDTLFLATIMHDAIYIPGESPLSERLSAQLVPQLYYEVVGEPIYGYLKDAVAYNIMATVVENHVHGMPFKGTPGWVEETKRMLDLDLNSLSSPPEVFDHIQNSIALEHAYTGATDLNKKGAAFLKQFLQKSRIYYTEGMAPMEQVARDNITNYIQKVSPELLEA